MKINHELPLPEVLKSQYPLSQELKEVKKQRDEEIRRIFTGESDKFIVLVGPCSADNEDTVCEYVRKLKTVADKVSDKLMIIPRVYTNKPRTTGDGYKGMLHQPDPDKAPDLLAGIIAIRKMHMRVMQETGLSSADEMLYPENRSYLDDILSYEAVGARSVENQQHRLTASGMDIPVGMKNPTSGDLSVMLNSVTAAQHPHHFIYRGNDVETSGNDLAHTILRGGVNQYGQTIPNYHYEDLIHLSALYAKKDLKNPAIKTAEDRKALQEAVNSGLIDAIATDHAPHLLSEKEGGALKAMSGMPMIQFSLASMLELVDKGIFSIEKIVEKMSHAPAQMYEINNRGFIHKGYQADLVLVRPNSKWTVTTDCIVSKCQWSPLEGHTFNWKVEKTFVNGHLLYDNGKIDETYRGQELRFR